MHVYYTVLHMHDSIIQHIDNSSHATALLFNFTQALATSTN